MAKDTDLQDAILRTLCYADVFDYPLTLSEVRHWLIGPLGSQSGNRSALRKAIREAYPKIKATNGYYHLKERSQIVALRNKRGREAVAKKAIAAKVASWLKIIPSVRMVATTGALAMENTDESDDIDLMLIARNKRLWLTRLFVLALVSLIAKRRQPTKLGTNTKKQWKNAICLNLFLDEDALAIPRPKRNLYTAHEVVQVKPIVAKDDIMERFLGENTWVKHYLPHSLEETEKKERKKGKSENMPKRSSTPEAIGNLLERLAYRLQKRIMETKRTNETIQPRRAFFHPRNTAAIILGSYQKRLRRFRL